MGVKMHENQLIGTTLGGIPQYQFENVWAWGMVIEIDDIPYVCTFNDANDMVYVKLDQFHNFWMELIQCEPQWTNEYINQLKMAFANMNEL
jgi:hypothetical protein